MSRHVEGRHELPPTGTRRRGIAAVGLGLALLLVASAVVIRQTHLDHTRASAVVAPVRTASTGTGAARASGSGSVSPAQRQAVASAVDACRLANLRQQTSLSSAAVSLSMWRKHVEAMNLLVSGKISLAVAKDFWESSRRGAMKTAAAFRAADLTYTAGPTSTCAPLDKALAPAAGPGDVSALAACATTRSRGDAALATARTAVTTWEHHIRDMEALRDGRISPAQATAMWQMNWMRGNAQLTTYDDAVAAMGTVTCPLR